MRYACIQNLEIQNSQMEHTVNGSDKIREPYYQVYISLFANIGHGNFCIIALFSRERMSTLQPDQSLRRAPAGRNVIPPYRK